MSPELTSRGPFDGDPELVLFPAFGRIRRSLARDKRGGELSTHVDGDVAHVMTRYRAGVVGRASKSATIGRDVLRPGRP